MAKGKGNKPKHERTEKRIEDAKRTHGPGLEALADAILTTPEKRGT